MALGLDDTIERRRGKRIAAKGIYRDPTPALCDLARADFSNITAPTCPNKTPLPFAR